MIEMSSVIFKVVYRVMDGRVDVWMVPVDRLLEHIAVP